jgi:DNA-binding LacI/PurR family transcriptional regulator
MARPGIQAVAAAAGVSTTTVSHVLSGKGRISEATRRRVREVADELGYQPSALARRLAGGRVGMLALSVSLVDDPALAIADFDYFLQVMSAATSAALERGYSLTVLPAQGRQTLEQLPLDGAIVIDPVRGDPTVEYLRSHAVPVVTTGRVPEGPDEACWVDNDHVAGTHEILHHLEAQGSERIALLSARPVSSYALDTLEAYRSWCAERGRPERVATVEDTPSEGTAFALALELLQGADPPDAIYATLDRLALGTLLAAEAQGIAVPGALRVAGCSDSEASRRARPALTALTLNPERIGEEAVDLLVALIEGEDPGDLRRIVPSEVVPRESTTRSVLAPDRGA